MSTKAFIEDRFLDVAEKAANITGQPLIFDVAQVMQDLYGYKPVTIPGMPSAPGAGNPYNIEATTQKRTTLKGSAIYGSKDLIGREVFCPVIIQARGVNYEFPFVVMGIQNRAIIKETPMVERGGSVIEEIAVESYKISLKGFLIDPLNQFPDEQLDILKQVWETRESVRLKSALSDLFLDTDDRVVLTSLNIPEKAKVVGVKDFSLEMVQDGILDLYSVE